MNWEEKGLKLVRETKFPEELITKLTFQCKSSSEMPIYLRYPSWAIKGISVSVNGKRISISNKPGSYISINRKWSNNDHVVAPFSDPNVHKDYYRYDFKVPTSVTNTLGVSCEYVDTDIQPVSDEKLAFRSVKDGIILKQLYHIHHQRYIVYWKIN